MHTITLKVDAESYKHLLDFDGWKWVEGRGVSSGLGWLVKHIKGE